MFFKGGGVGMAPKLPLLAYVLMLNSKISYFSRHLNEDLADVIPAPIAKLKQSCPFVDPSFEIHSDIKPNRGAEIAETNDKIWATSLALKWLTRSWSQYEEEWGLVAQKACTWLRLQKRPTGFEIEDIELMAQQSLNVLIVSSRRASCH